MTFRAKFTLFACLGAFMASALLFYPASPSFANPPKYDSGTNKIYPADQFTGTGGTLKSSPSGGVDPYIQPLFAAMETTGDLGGLSPLVTGLVQALVGLGIVVLVGSAVLRALRMIM